MNEEHLEWLRTNQRLLMAEVERVRALIEKRDAGAAEQRIAEAEAALSSASSLERITAAFGLSPFERDVLLLCAAVELDGSFSAAVAAASEERQPARPTFSLALAALPLAHWSALAPAGPLRRWHLIELDPGHSLTSSPLRISERVLHHLAGVPHMDERWNALVTPVERPAMPLPPSHAAIATEAGRALATVEQTPLLIELTGNDAAGKKDVALEITSNAGLRLYAVVAADLPAGATDRDLLARLWEREAILGGAALFVDAEELSADARRNVAALLDRMQTLVLIGTREPLHLPRARPLRFEVRKPTFAEQREIWTTSLGGRAADLNGELDRLPSQFDLSARLITATVDGAGPEANASELWDRCRISARPRMQDLARRILPVATWNDLVLPQWQSSILREIVAHVRHRVTVYEKWGFASRSSRGLGIGALFCGVSGTGKTMAAEVLANELRLDLYQIDLSAVVSKYIGETEENLRRVFDAAEEGGALLLFDEADALFGKRTEVRDSHDRYANIEVSYLLQRMETYRGVAILTTNMKSALDAAFLRRLRFVVDFPFPDAQQRGEIWRHAFPAQTPLDPAIDVEKLSRLNVTGGNIRNIALAAAFHAAGEHEPVSMKHILQAVRGEYAKLERSPTQAEIGSW